MPLKFANNRRISGSGVPLYESILDMFTLLSFVLIAAAAVRANRLHTSDQEVAAITTEKVGHAANVQNVLPRDEMLIMIYSTNATDWLGVLDGRTQSLTNIVVPPSSINRVMDGLSNRLTNVRTLDVGAYGSSTSVSPVILFGVERWLNRNNIKNYHLFFAGPEDE